MSIRGVITGDIIGSSKMKGELRYELLQSMENIVGKCKYLDPSLMVEFYRGDSVQIISSQPEIMANLAIILRSKIKSYSCVRNNSCDIRLSIGIGEVSYRSENIVTSDGEAFQLSGRNLDNIGKRKLVVSTKWQKINDELEVSTAFLDALITDWTKSQSEMIYNYFLYPDKTQIEIGDILKTSNTNVNNLLGKAKYKLVELYIKRFQELIKSQITSEI